MVKNKKTVLIVDDETDVVDFLERFMNRFNITVIKATGGEDALDLYQQYLPDWVFLDIQMPDKDGVSVLKELKKKYPKSQVIMITGQDDKKVKERARKYGALDYILKPLDLMELSQKVKKYIL
ncbi:MAG: response regulator [Candidatus Omnitrophica bacterium]|nr:response regulator [Candidatus Omnitrophota bacterium]